MKAISEKSEGVWRPSPGSVYPTLQQLVDEGLIAVTGDDGSRSDYTLTDTGIEYVSANRELLDRAWAPMAEAMSERGALVSASQKLSAAIKQVGAAGSPEQKESAAAKLDEVRKDLYRMLAED
jgi:DNA-binding PadR family transcriptional regulator